MIRVTQKGSIITGEQYKKMSCSVELSKGIVSSYLVKFQMIFHMTAKPETIPPHVSRCSLEIHYVESSDSTLRRLSPHSERFVCADN